MLRRWLDGLSHPRLVAIVGSFLGVVAFAWAFGRHLQEIDPQVGGSDFVTSYYAAKGLLTGGVSVYDHDALLELAARELGVVRLPRNLYPPLPSCLLLPLALLDYGPARILWLCANQLLLALTMWGLARLWREQVGVSLEPLVVVSFGLLATASAPVFNHNWQGQTNLLVLALTTWAIALHLRGRRFDTWCGLLLGAGIALKLYPAVLLPYLLVRRRYVALGATASTCLVLTALSLLVVPWSDYARYPEVLLHSMYLADGGGITANLSMDATGRALSLLLGLGPSGAEALALALRVVPYPVLLWLTWRELAGEPERVGVARLVPALRLFEGLLFIGCIMTKWWLHHLVLLLPCFFLGLCLARSTWRFRGPSLLLMASVTMVALVEHPLLVGGRLHPTPLSPLRPVLWELDRLALLLLVVAVELLIWQLTRGASTGRPAEASARRASPDRTTRSP
ncbi:MAG: DUF2029 domain-containing protein [Deltaproteobacteria bacterium]|jgi:hypothetical protein|nr:DUF2029 domain-containing protein [Deltaproteobacteria bacterium]